MPEMHGQAHTPKGESNRLDASLAAGVPGGAHPSASAAVPPQLVTRRVDAAFARGVDGERFAREMARSIALQHPNILPVHDAGVLDDGIPFYTIALVDGETLRARLNREPLALVDALVILRDVAKALDFAHAKGVVHANLTPDNVVLSGGGAMVTEFGIARAINASRSIPDVPSLHHTMAKTADVVLAFGTPAYMAPEKTIGDTNLDPRTDIYAFGCVAYELVADGPPFGSRASHQLLMAHVSKAPQPLASRGAAVPQALDDLIMACLRKRPTERPQSARELVASLENLILS